MSETDVSTDANDADVPPAGGNGYAAPSWMIWLVGLYLLLFIAFFVHLVILVWPGGAGEADRLRLLGFIAFRAAGEVRYILLAASMGAVGSAIQAMTFYGSYVGKRAFERSWTVWYVFRPFVGMPLALIFYFVIRGGFFSLAAGTDAVSPFGVAALCGLVGMFSKQAMDKLQELFGSLFRVDGSGR
jgi:hypothetical protein